MTSLQINFRLSNKISYEKKNITSKAPDSLPDSIAKRIAASPNEDFKNPEFKSFLPTMIRTHEIGDYMSIPRTVFYEVKTSQGLKEAMAKKKADRYIGMDFDFSNKVYKITASDIFGIEEPETTSWELKTMDDAVRVFDFVSRWPMAMGFCPKNFGDDFHSSFSKDFMEKIENYGIAPTSNVVIEGNSVFTYEFSRPSVLGVEDLKKLISSLGKEPKAWKVTNSQLKGGHLYSHIGEILDKKNHLYSHLCF